MIKHWRCKSCHRRCTSAEILTSSNPFDATAPDIEGCPHCGEVDNFESLCDEPGCVQPSCCGTPTKDWNYRWTCHQHKPESR